MSVPLVVNASSYGGADQLATHARAAVLHALPEATMPCDRVLSF